MEKKPLQQLSLWSNCDLVDPAISAEQYQLQHAHSNILKKPPAEGVPLKEPPEAYKPLKTSKPVYAMSGSEFKAYAKAVAQNFKAQH